MKKITVFYSRRLGIIKEMVSGVQSYDWFGQEAEDYAQIYDVLIVDEDPFIWHNYNDMIVTEGKLKLIQTELPSKYL